MPPDLTPFNSNFGDLIRTRRIANGLTQAELAERAGLSVRGLSDLERGVRTRPQRETVERLLAALGGSPEERAAFQRAARSAPSSASSPRQDQAARGLPPGRLPQPGGSLLGRSDEIARLQGWLLEPAPGIVTLTGPGGSGKTRLAVSLASEPSVLRHFAAGVVFVDLATVREPHHVLPAVAVGLGWAESSRQATAHGFAHRLQGQRLLLLLDNFEQVIAAAPDIAGLSSLLPEVALLVTSREPLQVRGERCLPVAPLLVPESLDVLPAEALTYPAIQLFARRAQAAQPDFTVTDANVRDVVQLCQRLDGLPLAIELAASLTATHTLAMLLRRLEKRAALPVSLRDLPNRQRSLESVVSWSEALLTPEERALFQLLGVFDGSFSLETACQVWAATRAVADPESAETDLEDLLASLVQRSLLQRDNTVEDETRFRLLETIRAVAESRLHTGPDRDRVRAAQAAAMQDAAERAELWRRDRDFDARLRRLERDLPNLRAALDWLSSHDLPGAARLLDTLGSFWALCGYGAEGLAFCEATLSRYTAQDLLRSRLLRHAAWLATNLGEFARAERHIVDAHDLAAGLGDEQELAFVRFVRGNIAQGLGRMDEAEREIERALQVFQASDETWATFASNAVLGMVALDRGDAALAEARYEAALRLAASDIAVRDRATALCNIAVAQRWQGRMDDAVASAEYALALTEGIVAWSTRAGAWQVLARGALDAGDLEAARTRLQASLHHWQRSGDQRGLAGCLEFIAAYAVANGAVLQAVTLLAAVAVLREQVVGPGSVLGAAQSAALEESVRATLERNELALATARGRSLATNQALSLARAILEHGT
jgi:predicted ATPase/DNA-binding XRE family transcriptional regulator